MVTVINRSCAKRNYVTQGHGCDLFPCEEQDLRIRHEHDSDPWPCIPCAGVMKKWGFKGMPATHGVSLSHRHGGAIGGRTNPGKVYKGKKMPGNMGDDRRTVHDCLVYKVGAGLKVQDTASNIEGGL
jgi:hypothetical protein